MRGRNLAYWLNVGKGTVIADRGPNGMASLPSSRRSRIRLVAAWLAVLAVALWAVRETQPQWRRYWTLWTAPAPASLPIPVKGVQPRAIRDSWEAARDAGARKHQGIDIFARRGTPVISPVDGVVIGKGQDRLGGNVVRVLGPGHQVHYFAHLDAFSDVDRGDWVAPGAILGFVGTTGNARGTPPHLHYGIYTAGGAVNPYPLLASR
jgi:murein DD-endopeptidase MepM/ murein hydrolase activator NlpD